MLLTPDQEMIRDAVRDFAQRELWPHAARWDKEHHFPHDVHQGLAALGAYGICVPEEYGGAQLDYLSLALGKVAHGVADHFLVGGEQHGGVSGVCCSAKNYQCAARRPSWCSRRPLSAGVRLASTWRMPCTLCPTVRAAPAPPMSVCTQPGSMVTRVASG